ncbi:ABC transporter ATP-binding protein [Paenibacillus marinisediminis]
MRNMWRWLRPYRKPFAFAIAMLFVELSIELLQPVLIARVINEGIMPQRLNHVLLWGGIMLGLTTISFTCGIINSFFAARVGQNVGFDIRKKIFEQVQSFSYSNFNQFPTSTLITRVTSDVTQLQNLVFMGMRIILRAPLILIGGLVMALLVNARLAFILAIVTPVLFLFLLWMMKMAFKLFRAVQERLDRTNGIMRENLLGIRLIRAFVRSKYEVKRFEDVNQELMERNMKALWMVETTVPVLTLVMNACILFILWFGSKQVHIWGGANVGEVVAVINYGTRMIGAFSVISMVVMTISRAKASLQRIEEVLDTKAGIVEEENVDASRRISSGEVEFDHVSFRYPGAAEDVLDAVSFTARPGQMVAVMGATGAGKSSLFQLIPRLYDVTAGSVKIDGTDVRKMKLDSLRRDIGFVPQESLLFTGTVQDNIRWGREDASLDDIVEAAKAAQIHDTVMKLPLQYDTVIGQKGVNLSGGQKQRLAIARALVRKPKLLLLDDSTSALDVRTEARLLAELPKLNGTTLIITQKISAAMHADTILLMDEGRLLAQGEHHELLKHSELYRRIVHSQLGEEAVPHVQANGTI